MALAHRTERRCVRLARRTGEDVALDGFAASIAASGTELHTLLTEVAQISSYTDLDALRSDFGLSFTGSWSDSNKEIAVLGAILTERAFRGADTGGRLDGYGFGNAFSAITGGIHMNEDQDRTNEVGVDLGGAKTTGSHGIDWYRNDVDVDRSSIFPHASHTSSAAAAGGVVTFPGYGRGFP